MASATATAGRGGQGARNCHLRGRGGFRFPARSRGRTNPSASVAGFTRRRHHGGENADQGRGYALATLGVLFPHRLPWRISTGFPVGVRIGLHFASGRNRSVEPARTVTPR